MSPALRRAALRRLILRSMLSGALLVAGISALVPSAWLGAEPMLLRLALVGTAAVFSALVVGVSFATRKRPRVTGPRSEPDARFVA